MNTFLLFISFFLVLVASESTFVPRKPSDGLTKYVIYPPPNPENLRFLIFAYGTRGDLQPIIHLAHLLRYEGHSVLVAAHSTNRVWIEDDNELDYVEFDAKKELMDRLMSTFTENGISSLKSNMMLFKTFDYLEDTYNAAIKTAQDPLVKGQTDVVIAPNWYFFGSHVAEYLNIPYLEAQFFPTTKTRAFDLYSSEESLNSLHAIFPMVTEKLSKLSYVYSEMGITVLGLRGINRMRKRLNLRLLAPREWYKRMHAAPIIYAFSQNVIAKPKEWSHHVNIVGYWFTKNSGMPNWNPSESLLRFLDSDNPARKQIIYVDLSSMTDFKPTQRKLISSIKQIPLDTKYKWILATGKRDFPLWKFLKYNFPRAGDSEVFFLKEEAIPHTWLLPRVDVYFHHGGAGTTAASYRSATLAVIVPQLGDQVQNCAFAQRLHVGQCLSIKDTVIDLERVSDKVLGDTSMKKNVEKLAMKLGEEDADKATLEAIYTELDYILTTGNQFPGQYISKSMK